MLSLFCEIVVQMWPRLGRALLWGLCADARLYPRLLSSAMAVHLFGWLDRTLLWQRWHFVVDCNPVKPTCYKFWLQFINLFPAYPDIHVCENEKPCQNGATCFLNDAGEYNCLCPEGFHGKNCELKTGPCHKIKWVFLVFLIPINTFLKLFYS